MSCAALLKACNYEVDVVDKSHCGLETVPDDILRYGRSVDELLLDSNQIRDIPKVYVLKYVARILWSCAVCKLLYAVWPGLGLRLRSSLC